MAKWRFDRAGKWVYPTLSVTATFGDVIDSSYQIDEYWTQVDDATAATIAPPAPVLPAYSETPDGAFLIYSREANNFVPTVVAPFDEFGRVKDDAVPERLSAGNLDIAYVRNSEIGPLIDSRVTGNTLVVSADPYGATGDGVTDDTAAFTAAAATVSSGSALVTHTVFIPPGEYAVTDWPDWPSNVAVRAERGSVTIRLTASVAVFVDLTGRENVSFEGIRFELNGLATAQGFKMAAGTANCLLLNCVVKSNAASTGYAVDMLPGARDCSVIACQFLNLTDPVHVRGDVVGGTIRGCTFKGYGDRGIFVIGETGGASTDLSILDNKFSDAGNFRTVLTKTILNNVATLNLDGETNPYEPGMKLNVQGLGVPFDGTGYTVTVVSGMDVSFALTATDVSTTAVTASGYTPPSVLQDGDPRQPIAVQISTTKHVGLRVNDNVIVGNYVAHHVTLSVGDPESGTLLGGTADMISIHGAEDFQCMRNILRGGGEVGITISNTAENGRVGDNTVTDSNTNGIFVGGTTVDIDIINNSLKNNGHEWGAPNGPRMGARSAINIQSLTGGTIAGNRCVDDQAVATQLSVVFFSAATKSDVELGHNPRRGGTTKLINPSTVATSLAGVRFNQPVSRVTASADELRGSLTLSAHGELKFTGLDPNGVYRLVGHLPYAATQAADIAFKFTGPSGAVLDWNIDGAILTSTSTTGAQVSSRARGGFTTTFTLGGGGTTDIGNDLVARIPPSYLTMGGTAGDLTLTWGQGTTADATLQSALRKGASLELQRVGYVA